MNPQCKQISTSGVTTHLSMSDKGGKALAETQRVSANHSQRSACACLYGKPPVEHSNKKEVLKPQRIALSLQGAEVSVCFSGIVFCAVSVHVCVWDFVLCSSFICSTDDSLVAGVHPLQSASLTFRCNALLTDTCKPHSHLSVYLNIIYHKIMQLQLLPRHSQTS